MCPATVDCGGLGAQPWLVTGAGHIGILGAGLCGGVVGFVTSGSRRGEVVARGGWEERN